MLFYIPYHYISYLKISPRCSWMKIQGAQKNTHTKNPGWMDWLGCWETIAWIPKGLFSTNCLPGPNETLMGGIDIYPLVIVALDTIVTVLLAILVLCFLSKFVSMDRSCWLHLCPLRHPSSPLLPQVISWTAAGTCSFMAVNTDLLGKNEGKNKPSYNLFCSTDIFLKTLLTLKLPDNTAALYFV